MNFAALVAQVDWGALAYAVLFSFMLSAALYVFLTALEESGSNG